MMMNNPEKNFGEASIKGYIQPRELVERRRATLLKNHSKELTPCANCGKEKYHIPSRRKEYNYCSPHCCLEFQYKHGLRDKNKQTEKAHIGMHKLIENGEWSLQNPENVIKGQKACGSKNYGKTWLEEKMGWALTKLGIKFESQYPVKYGIDILNRNRYYFPDFAIPKSNLLIECDGSYWHKNKKRENLRESRLKELGWNIVRFSDTEIKSDLMSCANKVKTWLPVV